MKSKKCKHKGCNNPVWSDGMCKNHIAHKPLKSHRKFVFKTDKKGRIKMAKAMQRMLLFQEIWNERPHWSEVSNTPLGTEPRSTFFHHILPKSKYPIATLDKENIIILTSDEHNNVENDMFKYNIINERRKELLKKYDLI